MAGFALIRRGWLWRGAFGHGTASKGMTWRAAAWQARARQARVGNGPMRRDMTGCAMARLGGQWPGKECPGPPSLGGQRLGQVRLARAWFGLDRNGAAWLALLGRGAASYGPAWRGEVPGHGQIEKRAWGAPKKNAWSGVPGPAMPLQGSPRLAGVRHGLAGLGSVRSVMAGSGWVGLGCGAVCHGWPRSGVARRGRERTAWAGYALPRLGSAEVRSAEVRLAMARPDMVRLDVADSSSRARGCAVVHRNFSRSGWLWLVLLRQATPCQA